jgi:hypothetical protein
MSYSQKVILWGEYLDTTNFVYYNDTVVFGFDYRATNDIDEFLGEKELVSKPLGQRDIRLIKRSQIDFTCLEDTLYNPIYFDRTSSSKIDLRPISATGNDLYFELQYSYDFKAYRSTLKQYGNSKLKQRYLGYRVKINCDDVSEWTTLYNSDTSFIQSLIFGIISLEGDSVERIFFHLKPDLKLANKEYVAEMERMETWIAHDNLRLITQDNVELYSIYGQKLVAINSLDEEKIFDLSSFSSGTYFLRTLDKNGRLTKVRRVLKI